MQQPKGHLGGYGCNLCAIDNRIKLNTSNTDEFIEKAKIIHGNTYNYSKVEYINSDTKVIITCKNHGDYLQNPTEHLRGRGCIDCVNKTERILYDSLITIYPNIIRQYKQSWSNRKSFDFCIEEYKIIIELDGKQHFHQVRNWWSPEEQLQNDLYKEKCANDNNYSIIRLLQEDVFYNKYDWLNRLCFTILLIKDSGNIENHYLCLNDEYKNYLL